MKTVVFRVDSSSVMGVGHLMRCLTLAQAIRGNGGLCVFLCRDLPGNQSDLVIAQGFARHMLHSDSPEEVLGLARDAAADWLVVDHYNLEAAWERAACPADTLVAVIDDLADRPHVCRLLLDQNLGVGQGAYDGLVQPDTRLLLGPQYALLRSDFAQARAASLRRRAQAGGLDLFINFGGADPCGATAKVLTCLKEHREQFDKLTVVLGGAISNPAPLRAQATALGANVITNTPDMAHIMAEADLAIGAAGTTAWERCCLGLPTGLVVVADNQRSGAQALQEAGAAVILADLSAASDLSALPDFLVQCRQDRDYLVQMSANAAAVVDGRGVERVAAVMRDMVSQNG